MMMPPSSNGAPVVAAEFIAGSEAAFVDMMNDAARELGMMAEFRNSHGALEHYSNAYSMAILAREIIKRHPDILRVAQAPYVMYEGVRHNSTNRFFNNVDPFRVDGVDGLKTGTTRAAGHSVTTTAYRNGRRVITVNMASRDNTARYTDARALIEFGFAELERRAAEAEVLTQANIGYNVVNVGINFPEGFPLNNLGTLDVIEIENIYFLPVSRLRKNSKICLNFNEFMRF